MSEEEMEDFMKTIKSSNKQFWVTEFDALKKF